MDIPREAQAVLDFWFGSTDSPVHGQARAQWFRKNPAFDAEIRARFGALHALAMANGLPEWEHDAHALLARIVVLDQFSRNMFRGAPAAFAADPLALADARLMLARDWDRLLLPVLRWFVYLPLEHSENLADQEQCVALMGRVAADPRFAEGLASAERHRDVIARFGRFPHRNAILGRASTPEEVQFLSQPGSSF